MFTKSDRQSAKWVARPQNRVSKGTDLSLCENAFGVPWHEELNQSARVSVAGPINRHAGVWQNKSSLLFTSA